MDRSLLIERACLDWAQLSRARKLSSLGQGRILNKIPSTALHGDCNTSLIPMQPVVLRRVLVRVIS